MPTNRKRFLNRRTFLGAAIPFAAVTPFVGLLFTQSALQAPPSGTWAPTQNTMAAARAGASATTLLNGKVLVADGNDGVNDLPSAEVYDPATGTFSPAGSLSAARRGHLAFLLPNNNSVLIVGGTSGGNALASAELYAQDWTVSSGSFRSTGSVSSARSVASGGALQQDGLLLVAGGAALSSAEVYGFPTVKTDQDDYAPARPSPSLAPAGSPVRP